jgi:hypothetical protein
MCIIPIILEELADEESATVASNDDFNPRTLSVAWSKAEPFGAEYADLEIGSDRLLARGTAIGSDPVGYRLDYGLETAADFITSRLTVTARGHGWSRHLALEHADSGAWSCEADQSGRGPDMPAPGGDMSQFDEALDPDLGLSPVFNSMPVLRHRLLGDGEAPELLMVWISVPDLAIYPSPQRYSSKGSTDDGNHLIHFEAPDPDEADFVADVVFDSDGVVLDYPGIATRIRSEPQ